MVSEITSDVALRLTTNGQDFSQSLTFTYRDSPEVYGFNPPYGSSSRSDAIAITGANFFPDTQANCLFNGSIVTAASFQLSTLVLCLSPTLALDDTTESLQLTVAVVFGGTQYVAPGNFSIYAQPKVSGSTPAFITGSGGVLKHPRIRSRYGGLEALLLLLKVEE
ncbi:hypothetical protein PRIC1_000854 [Phytophthora ramorum]